MNRCRQTDRAKKRWLPFLCLGARATNILPMPANILVINIFFFVILDVVEPPIFASPFLVFCIFLNVRWMLFAVRVDELVATREARGRHSENLD